MSVLTSFRNHLHPRVQQPRLRKMTQAAWIEYLRTLGLDNGTIWHIVNGMPIEVFARGDDE